MQINFFQEFCKTNVTFLCSAATCFNVISFHDTHIQIIRKQHESSHAKQIQRILPWGHGSVICQTKCFLRLAMCTHQVSVTCKSHFTKCQKAFHCNLRGGEANINLMTLYYCTFESLTPAAYWTVKPNYHKHPWGLAPHKCDRSNKHFPLHLRGDHIWCRGAKKQMLDKKQELIQTQATSC